MSQRRHSEFEFLLGSGRKVVLSNLAGADMHDAITDASTELSIGDWPKSKIFLDIGKYPDLAEITAGDSVRLRTGREGEELVTLFVGEVMDYEIVKTESGARTLKLFAVSSFSRLTIVTVSSSDFSGVTGVRQILERLIWKCEVQGVLEVHESVGDELTLGPVNEMTGLALLKHICLQRELVIDCPIGDKLRITTKNQFVTEKVTKHIPTINAQDMKSFTIRRGGPRF